MLLFLIPFNTSPISAFVIPRLLSISAIRSNKRPSSGNTIQSANKSINSGHSDRLCSSRIGTLPLNSSSRQVLLLFKNKSSAILLIATSSAPISHSAVATETLLLKPEPYKRASQAGGNVSSLAKFQANEYNSSTSFSIFRSKSRTSLEMAKLSSLYNRVAIARRVISLLIGINIWKIFFPLKELAIFSILSLQV